MLCSVSEPFLHLTMKFVFSLSDSEVTIVHIVEHVGEFLVRTLSVDVVIPIILPMPRALVSFAGVSLMNTLLLSLGRYIGR